MSDLNIALILKLVDNATAPARRAMQNLTRLNTRTAEEQRIAMRRAAGATVATTAAVAAMVKPAIDFETAMAGVAKVVDFEAASGLKDLGAGIQKLSMASPMAAEGVAALVEAGARMGVVNANLPDDEKTAQLLAFASAANEMNQTGFTGELKAWKVSHDQRKFRKPFFNRSAGARSAFGA